MVDIAVELLVMFGDDAHGDHTALGLADLVGVRLVETHRTVAVGLVQSLLRVGDTLGQHGHTRLRKRIVDTVQIPAGAERSVIVVPVGPADLRGHRTTAAAVGTAAPAAGERHRRTGQQRGASHSRGRRPAARARRQTP